MDWTLCAICQKDTEEKLNCPIASKHTGHETVYKDVLDRALRFKELDAMPIAFDVDNADHVVWKEKDAAWHRSCTKLFSSYMLQRVEDSKNKSRKRKLTRSGTPVFEQMKCVFCQDELAKNLHKCEKLDDKVKRMAHSLGDDRLIGLLEKGDVVALDIQYHRDCLTTYARAYLRKIKPVSCAFSTDEVAKEELFSKIEDDIASGITVFCMRELLDVYQTMLGDMTTTINQTRLKREIIARFPDFQEQQGARRSVYLIASKEMRKIISGAIQCDAEGHAKILVKAAMICRRAVSATERFNFDGSLSSSTEVVPPQLAHLFRLLLYGYHAGGDHRTMSKPEKTISELLVFNMENLSRRRETPLPIYIGIWLHSQTRSKKHIKHMSELGMSVSFDRVISIEKRLAETVAHQARADGIVCPHNLRNHIFTVGALDNLDHNPTSRTSKTSFHGTGISVFQQRSVTKCGTPRDTCSYSHEEENRSQLLPDCYTVVAPLTRSLVTDIPPPRLTSEPHPAAIEDGIIGEITWMKHIRQLLQSGTEAEGHDVKAMWSSYHASGGIDIPMTLPAIIGILPFFYESSSDPRIVKHGMEIVRQIVHFLNPGQIPVLAVDQPLYAIAKKLQWTFPDEIGEQKFVVMMGGLHIEMALWHTLGDILRDSGWVEIVSESGIATPGTAASFLTAADPMKTRYAHQVTVATLDISLQDAYRSADTDLPLVEWMSRNAEMNPTFAFWLLIMKYQQLMLLFVRAHRQRNFWLFVETLKALVGIFFAMDHHNYARWLPVFIADLESLPSSVLVEFEVSGNWTISRTMNRFSAIAIDHAHEQNNKLVKGVGGIIGLTEDPASLAKWVLIGPTLARLVDDFQENDHDTDELRPHHEEGKSPQLRFLRHVQNMSDSILHMGNPFQEEEKELVSLHGRVCLSVSSSEAVKQIDTLGRSQYEDYKEAVLETEYVKQRKTATQKTLSHFKDHASLYGQLFVSLHTRQGNLGFFFEHESVIPPPAMKTTNDKAALYHCITESDYAEGPDALEQTTELPPTGYNAVIIDGGALIHTLPPKPSCSTFDDYAATVFCPRLRIELKACERLDIIWDRYFPKGIKGSARSKRADGAGGGTRQRIAGNAKVPQGMKTWEKFLADSSNKEELFEFLSSEAMKNPSYPGSNDLYMTSGAKVVHTGPGDEMVESSNHEEADTRIVVHIMNALHNANSILIRTGDTDVFIIILGQFCRFHSINPNLDLWIAFGSGKHQKMLHINRLHQSIGPERCLALSMFHAMSGCDTTNGLNNKGKRIWWNTWNKHPEITEKLVKISKHPFKALVGDDFAAIEDFVCRLYDQTSTTSEVNILRMNMFCQRRQDVQRIPPTQDALMLHLRRAVYQASIWYTSHQSMLPDEDPCSFGWQESNNNLTPRWTSRGIATEVFKLTVKCACRKQCSASCSCKKEHLDCTPLCKCSCLK